MTCRKRIDGIKTEASRYLGISLGENLPTAQAVPGMEVARAWLRLWCGTWEPVALKATAGLGGATRPVVQGRTPSSGNCEGQSTDAGHRDGPPRTSDEAW
jgi:hypothetical protein